MKKAKYRKNINTIVSLQGSSTNRRSHNAGTFTYAGKNTTKIFNVRNNGILKGKIKSNDFEKHELKV